MRPASTPRPNLYTPSALSLFRGCPQRYFLAKVAHHRAEEPFSAPLARGKAAHRVLEACARACQRGEAPPDNLEVRVTAALPRDGYPDARARAADAAAVTGQVEAGLRRLAGGRRVLAVEAFLRYPYRGDATTPPFVLGASADLILEGVDDDGARFLEVLDWKTGAGRGIDLLQELALRVVARHAYRDSHPHAYIVSTTAFLAEDAAWSVVRDDDACRRTWADLKATVAAIEAEAAWPPEPGTRCLFCPYFRDGCALDRPGGEEETADWLDGVGDEEDEGALA